MFLIESVCTTRGLGWNECFHVQYHCLYPCLPGLSNIESSDVDRLCKLCNVTVEKTVLYTRDKVSQNEVFEALGRVT